MGTASAHTRAHALVTDWRIELAAYLADVPTACLADLTAEIAASLAIDSHAQPYTLRDVFAAAALAGLAMNPAPHDEPAAAANVIRSRALVAYVYADAMLQAREATP